MARKKIKALRLKKNQRKIDTTDLEDHLVKVREEALLGGPIEGRSDSTLFDIETKPVEKVVSRKQIYRKKVLSSDKALLPNPYVSTSKTIVRKINPKTASDALVAQYTKSKLLQKAQKTPKPKDEKEFFDVWSIPADRPDPEDFAENAKKFLRRPVPPPRYVPTKLPAVMIDKPGNSYNPTYEDHQDVLGEAVAQEIKKRDLIERQNERLKVPKRVKSSKRQNEMVDEADIEETQEDEKPDPDMLPEPKTRAQRQKKTRKLEALEESKIYHDAKRINKELDKIEDIVQDLDKMEESRRIKKQRMEEAAILKPRHQIRMGGFKFEEGPIEVLLTEKLPKNMRAIPKPLHPLHDRLEHMIRRNVLPVGVQKPAPKGKIRTIIV